MLNLKISITKVPLNFNWNSKKIYATKSQTDATINQILKTPTQDGLFPSSFLFKASISYYFTFHKNEALKKLWKMLLVSPKLLFWFLQYSNIRKKLESLKWNNYDIMKWIV